MKQIIIGKEGTQPFVITDPNVSRRHAYLNIDESANTMQLVDNKSTNGTFVYNGSSFVRLYANQPYNVTFDTMIQIGPNTRFHIRRLFQKPVQQSGSQSHKEPEQPKVKKVDISHLKAISDNYKQEKLRLDSKMTSINGLRTATIIISLGVSGGTKLVTSGMSQATSWILTLFLAIILWGSLQVVISKMSDKVMKKKLDNEHDYAVKYCCPECHITFKGKVYENILAEGKCPRCKTEYYES